MAKYCVRLIRADWFSVDVEVEDEEDAVEAAFEAAPYLCAQCSGWGQKGSVDPDEWSTPEEWFGPDFDEGKFGKTVELVEEDD